MLEQAALIKAITEQIKTQDYRHTYDQRIDLDLSDAQVALLLRMLNAALRDMPYA